MIREEDNLIYEVGDEVIYDNEHYIIREVRIDSLKLSKKDGTRNETTSFSGVIPLDFVDDFKVGDLVSTYKICGSEVYGVTISKNIYTIKRKCDKRFGLPRVEIAFYDGHTYEVYTHTLRRASQEMIDEYNNRFKVVVEDKNYELDFNPLSSSDGLLSNFALVKMKPFDVLISNANSTRFSKILENQFVIINKISGRVYNKLNPHLDGKLKEFCCSNYRVDYASICYDIVTQLEDDFKYAKLIVNFKKGTLKVKKINAKKYCVRCGTPLIAGHFIGRYCHDCLLSNEAYRYGYHDYYDGYSIKEYIDPKTTPVFGCEIERDYTGEYRDFNHNKDNAMLGILEELQGDELKKGTLKRDNVFMCDGSLNEDGIEWITFPHTFNWYLKNKDKIDKAIKKAQEFDFTNTSRAGNHIHINRDYFTDKNGKDCSRFCSAKIAVLFNKFWSAFTNIADRTDTSYTCKPKQNADDDIFTIAEKTIDGAGDHGVAVNLQHSATVEIRLWSAIKDADDLLFYLDNMQALAKYAKVSSLEKVQKAKITDYMKYFKLKNSLDIAYNRLNKVGTACYAREVKKLIEEKEQKKGENK